jgi:uncharacterized protein DUF6603
MSEAGDTIGIILRSLARALRPLTDRGGAVPDEDGVPGNFARIMEEAGVRIALVAQDGSPDRLRAILAAVNKTYQTIADLVERDAPPAAAEVTQLADAVQSIIQALSGLTDVQVRVYSDMDPVALPDLPRILLDHLIIQWLADELPALLNGLALLTLVDLGDTGAADAPARAARIDFERLLAVVRDPKGALVRWTGWNSEQFDAQRVLAPLGLLLSNLGLPAMFGFPEAEVGAALGWAADRQDAMLRIPFFRELDRDSAVQLGMAVVPIGSGAATGLALVPFGTGGTSQVIPLNSDWELDYCIAATASGQFGIVATPSGVEVRGIRDDGSSEVIAADLRLLATLAPVAGASAAGANPGIVLFNRDDLGSFVLGGVGLGFGVEYKQGDAGFTVELPIRRGRIKAHTGSGDGFLQKILPRIELDASFDVTVGLSSRQGLYFRGAAALEVIIPIHKSLLGIADLDELRVAVVVNEQGIATEATLTFRVALGPLHASVDRMGIKAALGFSLDGKGNAGLIDLKPAFRPPSGLGLVVEAGPVTGGGYILADPPNGKYAGILQLEIADTLAVTAIGLLSTKLPDGRPGFSLLIILAAEFPPIQLGFGFTLNGLGGLLGANRMLAVEALRNAARNGALDSVLFPHDPVANAPRVIRDVEEMFPVAEGRFVVGLMAALGWGTPALVRVDLGIIIELPSPVRIALLGRASVILPRQEAAVVELRVEVVGLLDLGAREFSIDATLRDSRIGPFAISGDLAARLNFGAAPAFAIAVGGFSPRFVPPPGFPALQRVAISLATSDNPRLRLEAYMATTAASIQMGSRLDIYAQKDLGGIIGLWSVSAFLGFDALVNLSPKFSFTVDVFGGAAIRRNGAVVVGAELRLTLTGPEPWHAVGSAEFEFLLAKRRVGFDVTIGDEPPLPAIPAADPIDDLLAALAALRNWSAQLPTGGSTTVAVRDLGNTTGDETTGVLLVHPFGSIGVAQRIVPLEVDIDRYAGNSVPATRRRLSVSITMGGAAASGTMARDAFPAGQFFDLSEDERLAGEAFPRLPNGLMNVHTDSHIPAAVVVQAAVIADDGYETAIVNPNDGFASRRPDIYRIAPATLDALVATGAAARGPLRTTGRAGFAGATLGIAVKEPAYKIATRDRLTTAAGSFASRREAAAVRAATEDANLQVVGAHEGVAA